MVEVNTGRPRILVTGSRAWNSVQIIRETLARLREAYPDAVLVHGAARGADQIAEHVWDAWGLPVEGWPAQWDRYGNRAGYVRNATMVRLGADVCVAFIRNGSAGATMCADLAGKAGIPTIRVPPDDKGGGSCSPSK